MSESERVPAVLILGLVFAIAGLVLLWRILQNREVPASKRWFDTAGALASILLGIMLCVIFAKPGETAAITVTAWLLPVPVLLAAVSATLRIIEMREDRRIRIEIGMSPLRRRLPWVWAAAAWVVVSMAGFMGAFVGLFFLRPDLRPSLVTHSTPVFLPLVLGGAAVAGFVQAWRRRVRDRQIEQDNLDRAQLEWIDGPPQQAPAWMPTTAGSTWVQWTRSLDDPVEAGQEKVVIAQAAVAVLAAAGAAAFVAWSITASTGASGLLVVGMAVVLFVPGFGVALYFLTPMTCGVRTAVQQLRAQK